MIYIYMDWSPIQGKISTQTSHLQPISTDFRHKKSVCQGHWIPMHVQKPREETHKLVAPQTSTA